MANGSKSTSRDNSRSARPASRHAVVPMALALLLMGGHASFAGMCGATPAVSAKDMNDFQIAPASILLNPHDSAGLEKQVANVVATETDTAASIVRISVNASAPDRKAIGQGLADAAATCLDTSPLESFSIQSAVFAAQPDVVAAFLASINDVKTSEIGPTTVADTGSGEGGFVRPRADDGPLGGLPATALTTVTPTIVLGDRGTNSVISKSP